MSAVLVFIAAVITGGLYYCFTPQLALDNPAMLFLAVVVAAVIGALAMLSRATQKKDFTAKVWLPAIALLALFIGLEVLSSGFLRSGSFHALLGEEKTNDFKSSLPPIDLANAPLVAGDMARRAAEKKLSDIPALGSQTHVGHMQKQLVNGKLFWVGFLQHRGFFAWNSQGSTPGYVRVSATDPSDVELVTELKGRKLAMRYLRSAYFGDEAERFLRFNGYSTAGLTDFSPEIDDEGKPYLVVTVFQRRVGVSGKDAVGVVTLDVQSGATQYYATADAPKWIDRIQPEELVEQQLADRLEYVHGWLNPSHKDRLAISGSLDVIYAKDGRAYFFAGLGSTAKEGGLVGFVLIDTRTKEVTRYNLVGVTEKVAEAAAEGVFPEKRYTATNPLPFVVEGVPAYVMALRDGTGIARAYGIVDIGDYQKVAVADTLSGAARLFQSKLNLDRTHTDSAERADEVRVEGKVARISTEVRGGNSTYVLMLEGQSGQLFSADVSRADDLSITKVGDTVALRTLHGAQRVQSILEFKNVTVSAGSQAVVLTTQPKK